MSTLVDKIWLLQVFQKKLDKFEEEASSPLAENVTLNSSSFSEIDNVQAALEALQARITTLENS